MNPRTEHTPDITLITVCRNSEATIAKTIESVLSQKDSGVEYVIVDGGSVDRTQEIVCSYQGIDRFVSEPDQGIADAFNKGIHLATGEIIGLINSDDQLCPAALASVRRYFSDHQDVDVIHGDVLLLEGNRVVKRVKPSGRWWYPWRLVLFNHPSTFVRRDVYNQFGFFNTTYAIAMDVEIFLRWIRIGVKIAYLPEVLVAMRAGGVSGQRAFDGYREVKRALLANQFPAIPTTIQYIARFGVQFIVSVCEIMRSLKRDT